MLISQNRATLLFGNYSHRDEDCPTVKQGTRAWLEWEELNLNQALGKYGISVYWGHDSTIDNTGAIAVSFSLSKQN